MIDPLYEQESLTPYVASPCDLVLQDRDRSVVVFGAPGCGKETAIEQMKLRCGQDVLFAAWGSSPLEASADATPEIKAYMAVCTAVAEAVVARVRAQPQWAAQLSDDSREFLRWLLEQSLEPRRRRVLLRVAPALTAVAAMPYTDLYADYDADSVRCQVDEMIVLARELGAQRIAVTLNIDDDTPPDRQDW
jgi:hypothetical protein